MAETVLVAGTASHVGKSAVATGLCRLLADRGRSVAPFKAQNMSNNARAVVTPEGGWGEVGVSQFVQARAARVTPTTDHNPVLLKPRGDGESQLVIDGQPVGHYPAGTYYDEHWDRAREAAVRAHDRLARENEVIVAEGAGSIAEINLHDRDLANVETARFADATVLLVADIERGGAFASVVGTLELAPEDVRDRIAGVVITKFRGDESLLEPGIDELEARTGVPVVGVLPHDDPGLPAEDSVSLPAEGERGVVGDDEVPDERSVTVGVPRFPRISNFTDLAPLARAPGVRVAYLPLDSDLSGVDAVVLPGSKNTVDDLLALRESGLADAVRAFSGPVVGVCGGYQMLGERITNADVEVIGEASVVAGLGLLPVETEFSADKRVEQVTATVEGAGPIDGAEGEVSGYEIHMGEPRHLASTPRPVTERSAVEGNALGTYLHGLFDDASVREAFLSRVRERAGLDAPAGCESAPTGGREGDRRSPHDAAADLVSRIDLDVVLDR